jgi:hypothetical protein
VSIEHKDGVGVVHVEDGMLDIAGGGRDVDVYLGWFGILMRTWVGR